MGQGLSVYLVPEATIRSLPGLGDKRLLQKVLHDTGKSLRQFDEQFEAGDLPSPLTMAEAIAGVLSGQFDPDYPFYGTAFEFICVSLGEQMNNRGFVPCSVDLYANLDKVLAARGVPLRMTDLIQDPPIELPDWDDLLCGHWSSEAIRRADPALAALLANCKDEAIHPSLEVVHGWLQRAMQQPGKMLIGCHS